MSLLLAMTEVKKTCGFPPVESVSIAGIEIVGGVTMIYNEVREAPAFHVGDKVIVMRNTEMAYCWIPEMDCLDGIETGIEQVSWDDARRCYRYHINADTRYSFDASCFMSESDIETEESFDVDNSAIDEFLNSFIR